MARLRIPGIALAAEIAITAALDGVLRRLEALERKPSSPPIVTRDFTAREGQFVRVQAPSSGLTIVLPKPTATNRAAEITFSIETTGPIRFVCVAGLVNREAFVVSTLLGTFKAICNGETGWSVGFGVTSTGNTPGPAGAPGQQGEPGEQGPPGEQGMPGDTANPLRPIPDQRVLGNDSGGLAYPAPITVHQELDWLGGLRWTFDGVDDQVSMGDVLNMTRTTPRSVFVWYQTTDTSGPALIAKQATSSSAGWRWTVSTTTLDFILRGTSQQLQIGATSRPPRDGSLVQWGFTYTGSSSASGVLIYLNSASVPTTIGTNNLTSESTTNTQALQLGMRGTPPDSAFPGTIAHVSVWNRVLTPAEVVQIYNGGTPPDLSLLSFFTDCIGWWKLDDTDTAAAGGVLDRSASGNHGTASGGLAPTGALSAGSMIVRDPSLWTTIAAGATGAYLMSSGPTSVPAWVHPANQTASTTGTQNALTFPTGFRNRDTLDLTLTGNTTLNGIDATSIPSGFEFVLRVGTSGGFTLTMNNESGSATATNRLNTPDNIAVLLGEDDGVYIRRALTRWLIVDRGWPNASTSIVYSGRAIQRAALTGAVTASQDSNATAFGTAAAKSVLTNATNATAVPAFLAGTAARQVFRINAANTGTEWATLTSDSLPPGPPGTDGLEGPQGDMGPPGPTGPTGPMGLQGQPGNDGEQGPQGEQGDTGAPGASGATGATGPTGPTGATGATGAAGAAGAQGPPGIDGLDGEQGPQGEVGPAGAAAYVEQALALVLSNVSTLNFTTGASTAASVTDGGGGRATIAINYGGTTSTINLTPSGALGVVDISTLNCGGSVTLQPSAAFDIDGFTQKSDGYWFDLIYRDTTTHIGTLNENVGATTTSIRNPNNAAATFTSQRVVRMRYANSRWRSGPPEIGTLAQGTVIGRTATGGTGVPVALSGTQLGENLRLDSRVDDTSLSGTGSPYAIASAATNWIRFTALTGTYTLNGCDQSNNGKIVFWHVEPGVTGNIVLTHNNGAVTNAQRFFCPGAVDLTIRAGEVAMTVFTSNRHRVVSVTRAGFMLTDGDKGDITVGSSATTLTIDDATITAAKLGSISSNLAGMFLVRINCASGGASGTLDDVTIWSAAAPFNLTIVDTLLLISTAGPVASSAAIRSASGGGGSNLFGSATFVTTSTGRKMLDHTDPVAISAAGSAFLRRDRSVVGTLILICYRT